MLEAAAAAMTALGAPRHSIIVRIAAASAVYRVWSGAGLLEIDTDDVDLEGGIYTGVGLLGSIPPLRQLVGGAAERLEFSLNATDGPIFALADEDADDVIGAPVDMGIVFFDADWQMVAPPSWLWSGTADMPSVSRSTEGLEITRGVSLSVGSAFTDRTRPQLTYFTDADQRRRSPTDLFCERVAIYTGTHTIKWPA